MTWVRITEDEARAARIEALALRSAGLSVDPLVVAMATAVPHTEEWISQQDEDDFRPTDDISLAMDRGIGALIAEDDRRRRMEARQRVHARELAPAGRRHGWLRRLFNS